MESLKPIAQVELNNFQDPIEKSDFNNYYVGTQSLCLAEKLSGNHNICEPSQNISSLTNVLVLTSNF